MLNPGPLIIKESDAVDVAEALSVTLIVKLDDPGVVGAPEMIPAERLSPAGSDPVATDHVYGGVPPVAFSACEYTTPTMPAGNEDVVMLNAGALITIDIAAVAEPEALSVTLTVKPTDPAELGVPDIVAPERLNPAGSDPFATDQVYGGIPPLALSVCEYATPTMPAGIGGVVILKAGAVMTIDSAAVADPDALSVTFTLKLEEPAVVGLPEIVPPARLSPAGRDPLATDHVYGGVPPLAFSGCE
jgi:hypothetical protein